MSFVKPIASLENGITVIAHGGPVWNGVMSDQISLKHKNCKASVGIALVFGARVEPTLRELVYSRVGKYGTDLYASSTYRHCETILNRSSSFITGAHPLWKAVSWSVQTKTDGLT